MVQLHTLLTAVLAASVACSPLAGRAKKASSTSLLTISTDTTVSSTLSSTVSSTASTETSATLSTTTDSTADATSTTIIKKQKTTTKKQKATKKGKHPETTTTLSSTETSATDSTITSTATATSKKQKKPKTTKKGKHPEKTTTTPAPTTVTPTTITPTSTPLSNSTILSTSTPLSNSTTLSTSTPLSNSTTLSTSTPLSTSTLLSTSHVPSTTAAKPFATVCGYSDTSSTDAVQNIIDQTGFVDWFDIMLNIFPQHEKNWLDALWTEQFPDQGTSPLSGCGNLNSDCQIDTKCQDYLIPMAYWVMTSIADVHSKLNTISYMFLWNGWLDGLSIDQIASDFSEPKIDWSFLSWLSAAFSMAAGLGTSLAWDATIRGMISMGSAAFNMANDAAGQNGQVSTTDVENALHSMMSEVGSHISTIMEMAVGDTDDASTLPIYTMSTLEYPTSRFLADNTLLLDQNIDNSTFMNAYNNMGKWVEQFLVDRAMASAMYIMIVDTTKTQDDCSNVLGGSYLTIKDKQRCVYLTRPSMQDGCGGDVLKCHGDDFHAPNAQADQWVNKLTDTYNFDLPTYYNALIDCWMNGDGKTLVANAGTSDGVAQCFFTLPSYTGHFYQEVDLLWSSTDLKIENPLNSTTY